MGLRAASDWTVQLVTQEGVFRWPECFPFSFLPNSLARTPFGFLSQGRARVPFPTYEALTPPGDHEAQPSSFTKP